MKKELNRHHFNFLPDAESLDRDFPRAPSAIFNVEAVEKKSREAQAEIAQLEEKVEALQEAVKRRELDLQVRMGQYVEISHKEIVQKELLQRQLRQAEEKNTALLLQFNELYQYCEGLYRDANDRRQTAENKIVETEKKTVQYQAKFQAQENTIHELKAEIESLKDRNRQSAAQTANLEEKVEQLTELLEQKQTMSFASVEQGKDCLRSTVQSLNDFFGSFQFYLDSIEKNGVTPITIRTGRLLSEHWNVQKRNLEKTAQTISQLMDIPATKKRKSIKTSPRSAS